MTPYHERLTVRLREAAEESRHGQHTGASDQRLVLLMNAAKALEDVSGNLAQARQERDEARLNVEGLRRSLYATEESSAKQYQRAEAAEATIATLRAELNAERLEVIGAVARKEAAQAENATLREQLAQAQRHIADLTDELYEAQNNPSYDGPSRVVATKRGPCTCWLGTDATFGSSEARMRCAVHGDPPHNVFTQEAQR